MTATERVLRGQNDDVLSMDDEGTYGERFFQLTFKDAIAQGIISDYKILTITVSDEHVREIIEQNRLLALNPDDLEEAEAQAVAAGIALKRVFQEHGISHAISFHRSIRAADRFREQQDMAQWAELSLGQPRPTCTSPARRRQGRELSCSVASFSMNEP